MAEGRSFCAQAASKAIVFGNQVEGVPATHSFLEAGLEGSVQEQHGLALTEAHPGH